jgi:hypothetical protein
VLETVDIAGNNRLNLSLDIKGFDLLQKLPKRYDKDVAVLDIHGQFNTWKYVL